MTNFQIEQAASEILATFEKHRLTVIESRQVLQCVANAINEQKEQMRIVQSIVKTDCLK